MGFTTTQQRILADWFGKIREHNERFDFPTQFSRVLAEDKPATITQQSDWRDAFGSEQEYLAFIEELGSSTGNRRKFGVVPSATPRGGSIFF